MLGVAVHPRELVARSGRAARARPRTGGRASLSRPWRQFSARARQELASAADDGDVAAEALERARAGLDRVDATRGAELGERDARELGGRVGEDRKPHSFGLQSSKRGAHLRGGPEVNRRAVLCVALEQRPPVAGAARVELGGCRGSILGQPFDVEHARGVVEPVAPELPRVTEHVELDRQRHRVTRRQSEDADRDADAVDQDVERRPDSAFDEVLVQLVGRRVGDAERRRPAARRAAPAASSAPRTAYSQAWAIFRSTRSQVPRPVPRSGTDEKVKITAAQRTTGAHRRSAAEVGTIPMIGSPPTHKEHGEGTRCKSGTVPPL